MSETVLIGSQKLTSNGKWGVAIMLASPLASAFCAAGAFGEMHRTYGGQPEGFFLGMGAAGIAFLASLVLVLVGREYHYTKPVESKDT